MLNTFRLRMCPSCPLLLTTVESNVFPLIPFTVKIFTYFYQRRALVLGLLSIELYRRIFCSRLNMLSFMTQFIPRKMKKMYRTFHGDQFSSSLVAWRASRFSSRQQLITRFSFTYQLTIDQAAQIDISQLISQIINCLCD